MNLEQTTIKISETWGIASPLPREHIPKRSRPKDQRILRIRGEIKRNWGFLKTQEIQFKRARDSRGFGTGLEARESQQRARRILAIMCTKNEIEIHHTRAQKRGDWIDSKSPEGTRRMGPPFPIKSNTNSHKSMVKSYSKERNGGRETQGRRPGRENNSRTSYKSRPT